MQAEMFEAYIIALLNLNDVRVRSPQFLYNEIPLVVIQEYKEDKSREEEENPQQEITPQKE